MVSHEGAIYVASNKGYNWKAAVQETVSATLNRTDSTWISGASCYTGTFSAVNCAHALSTISFLILADYLASVRSNVDRSISMYNNESTRLLIKVTSDKNELLLRVRVLCGLVGI
uniref:Photosynthesis system II assembly factor Ycf48/Hcf136-like domain-containing protein n=1 Tax=Brassica oleracea var. oleracea TaxID=109376 RepID=A0A0D3E1M6_BRAOL